MIFKKIISFGGFMNNIKMLNLFGAVVLLLTFAHSESTIPTNAKKSKTHERGYLFSGLDENATVNSQKRKTQQKLLEELVKIAKNQLKVQKEILDEVKQIRNPRPEKIVVNGKECIANSTPECFQMPLVDKAKKIPVYKNWLRNPNEKNTLALVRWESKYFNKISNVAHMRDFVITKFGPEALKTNFDRSTFDSIGGVHKVVRQKNNRYLLNEIASKKFEIILFFGKNPEMDYQSFYNYNKNVQELKNVTYRVVFYTLGAKMAFEDSAKVFVEMKEMLDKAKSVKVDKKLFKKASIYATPTMSIKIKKTGEITPITVGNMYAGGVQSRILKMLEIKKVIKKGHSPDFKMFERVGTVGTDYVKQYYNQDLNMTKIKELYRKEK